MLLMVFITILFHSNWRGRKIGSILRRWKVLIWVFWELIIINFCRLGMRKMRGRNIFKLIRLFLRKWGYLWLMMFGNCLKKILRINSIPFELSKSTQLLILKFYHHRSHKTTILTQIVHRNSTRSGELRGYDTTEPVNFYSSSSKRSITTKKNSSQCLNPW